MADYGPLGGVKIAGFISPGDTTDTYAVIDTQLGIDGLRNYSGNTTDVLSGTTISSDRRRAGMIVGVESGARYFKLKDKDPYDFDLTDWEEIFFTSGGGAPITGGTAFAGTQTLTFYNSSGGTFDVLNSAALFSDNDVNVTGGTYNPSNGCVTFTTNSGTSFDVCGFLTGFTDTYVTGGTVSTDGLLLLNWNTGGSTNPIDLSELIFTGNTSASCITELWVKNISGCTGEDLHIGVQPGQDIYFDSTGTTTSPSLYINSQGQIGIGTNSPFSWATSDGTGIEVHNDSINNQIPLAITETGTRRFFIETDFATTSNPVHFKGSSSTNLMTFYTSSSSSRVGIGTTVPEGSLQIAKAGTVADQTKYPEETNIVINNTSSGYSGSTGQPNSAAFRFDHETTEVPGALITSKRRDTWGSGEKSTSFEIWNNSGETLFKRFEILPDGQTIISGNTIVDGTIRITGGNPQPNYVLTSTGTNGEATWQVVSGSTFTGNTSADCITDLYVRRIHSCTPLFINPNDEGNVYFGSNSGFTVDVNNGGNIIVENTSGIFYTDIENTAGSLVLLSGGTTDLPRFGIKVPTYESVTFGVRGGSEPTFAGYGKQGDAFIYSSNNNNGLNIISAVGTGTDDYIRLFAGQTATGTPDLYIQGSGATRGNVGINNDSPQEKLHVIGDGLFTNNQNDQSNLTIQNLNTTTDAAASLRILLSGSTLSGGVGAEGISGGLYGFGVDYVPSGSWTGSFLPNSINLSTGGGAPNDRLHVNIGSRRGSDAQIRFFGGSDDFDTSSLLGRFFTSGLTITDNVNTDTLRIRNVGGTTPIGNLGFDVDGNVVTGTTGGGTFTGNTSGDCITDLYVTNIYGCSPLHIEPSGSNDVYIVENGGNVGIGTTSPGGLLELYTGDNNSSINNRLRFRNDDTIAGPGGGTEEFIGLIDFYGNENQGDGVRSYIGTVQDGNAQTSIIFGTTDAASGITLSPTAVGGFPSEAMRIDPIGRLSIGLGQITDIDAKLHVNNTDNDYSFLVEDSANPDTTPFLINSGGTTSIGTKKIYRATPTGTETKFQVSIGDSGLPFSGLPISTTAIFESDTSNNVGLISPDANVNQIYFGTPSDAFGAYLRWDYTNRDFILSTGNVSGKTIFQTGNGVEAARIDENGNFGIGTDSPQFTLDVAGETRMSGSTQNILTVIGSGDTQPLLKVEGSSGELFTVTDSLTGTLFAVNNISGLPILEVNSDDEILMGNYEAPSLNTTFKTTITSGSTELYSIPVSAYTGGFFEYTVTGSGARAGSIMSIFSGSSVNFTETTTTDIGDTSSVTFDMNVSGGTSNLTVSATTGTWEIKTIVRSI